MKLQFPGLSCFHISGGWAWCHLSALGSNNSIFISVGTPTHNLEVFPVLNFPVFLSDFLGPNNYTPYFQAKRFPSFMCLHLSNICRLSPCQPLSHHFAKLYRLSTSLSFKQRPPHSWIISALFRRTPAFCVSVWPHSLREPNAGSDMDIVLRSTGNCVFAGRQPRVMLTPPGRAEHPLSGCSLRLPGVLIQTPACSMWVAVRFYLEMFYNRGKVQCM